MFAPSLPGWRGQRYTRVTAARAQSRPYGRDAGLNETKEICAHVGASVPYLNDLPFCDFFAIPSTRTVPPARSLILSCIAYLPLPRLATCLSVSRRDTLPTLTDCRAGTVATRRRRDRYCQKGQREERLNFVHSAPLYSSDCARARFDRDRSRPSINRAYSVVALFAGESPCDRS